MELVASVGRRCCLASRESSGSFPGRRRRQQLLLRHLAQRPRPWHCDGPHHHTRSPPSQRASPRALAVKQERGSNPVGSPSLSLDLNQVREALIRMEDSIIFAIIGKIFPSYTKHPARKTNKALTIPLQPLYSPYNFIIRKEPVFEEREGVRVGCNFSSWIFSRKWEAALHGGVPASRD